jgi:hypothetical protein
MRNELTKESHDNLVVLSDIRRGRESASSPYGPVSQGLIPTHDQEIAKVDPLAQLSELLNSLESVVESLNYKSFTVYDTLNTAIEAVRVALLPTQTDEGGTDTLI